MTKTIAKEFEYKDLFGRDIKVGDYIAYSAIDGRSGTLRIGQVLKLTQSKGEYSKPEPKVFTKSWSNFEERGPEKSGRQKNVTLSFMDRMIVIDEATVSEKIKQDLAGPLWEHKWSETDGYKWVKTP